GRWRILSDPFENDEEPAMDASFEVMDGEISEPEFITSSSVARGRGKNKRIWTYYEDEELIKALYEISLDPKWKSEGGFKNGYCSVLENELKARLPVCGLSAIPHIESRVRHFRTKYEDCPVVEEDMVSMDTPQRSMDNRNSDHSTSSSSKRRKKHKDS
ncbi:hypothetical protein ACJX0J_041749, partial [Zea mays]